MPTIGIADKTTLDAVNVKLGATGDAASPSGTTMARLAELLGRLTATRAGYLDAAISGRASSAQANSIIAGLDTLPALKDLPLNRFDIYPGGVVPVAGVITVSPPVADIKTGWTNVGGNTTWTTTEYTLTTASNHADRRIWTNWGKNHGRIKFRHTWQHKASVDHTVFRCRTSSITPGALYNQDTFVGWEFTLSWNTNPILTLQTKGLTPNLSQAISFQPPADAVWEIWWNCRGKIALWIDGGLIGVYDLSAYNLSSATTYIEMGCGWYAATGGYYLQTVTPVTGCTLSQVFNFNREKFYKMKSFRALSDTDNDNYHLMYLSSPTGTTATGTAQAGGASTLTLAVSASAVDDFYTNKLLILTGGSGSGQIRKITAYNGTTKVATVSHGWLVTPGVTTTYQIEDIVKELTDGEALTNVTSKYTQFRISVVFIQGAPAGIDPNLYMLGVIYEGNNQNPFDWTAKTPTIARIQTASASLQTVVNVQAEDGGVAAVLIGSNDGTSRQARAVITVDGVVLSDKSNAVLAMSNTNGPMVYGSAYAATPLEGDWGMINYTRASDAPIPAPPWIGFKKSFKYEVSTSSGANINATAVIHT